MAIEAVWDHPGLQPGFIPAVCEVSPFLLSTSRPSDRKTSI